jgi:uncharacterized membrane protein YkgB
MVIPVGLPGVLGRCRAFSFGCGACWSALGSALAVGMFLTTLSFLITTPGVWEPSLCGFPALSAVPGLFLIKDLALLGISLWTLGEAWKASEQRV